MKIIKSFFKKINSTGENWATKIESLKIPEKVESIGDSINNEISEYSRQTKKQRVEIIVESEVKIYEMIKKNPRLNLESIKKRVNDYHDEDKNLDNTFDYIKSKNFIELNESINELKAKHPNLDWDELEPRIYKTLDY